MILKSILALIIIVDGAVVLSSVLRWLRKRGMC